MAKQIEYKVITNGSLPSFNAELTSLLSTGWQLAGTLAVVINPVNHVLTYYQAVIQQQ